ncbi:MAG: zinc ribbon domain-containing protein [Planctomycetota bacterium]
MSEHKRDCHICGADNKPSAQFCHQCGKPLAAQQPKPYHLSWYQRVNWKGSALLLIPIVLFISMLIPIGRMGREQAAHEAEEALRQERELTAMPVAWRNILNMVNQVPKYNRFRTLTNLVSEKEDSLEPLTGAQISFFTESVFSHDKPGVIKLLSKYAE